MPRKKNNLNKIKSFTTLILIIGSLLIKCIIFKDNIISFLSLGAISINSAKKIDCNGISKVCAIQDGKLIAKKIDPKKQVDEDSHQQYASNVSAAVESIRKYTKTSNLNVSLIPNTRPIYITFYCNVDKCWAVNNENHKVITTIF